VSDVAWVIAVLAGVAAIVWGAEAFAEHVAPAAVALRVSTFAVAVLLAGAEPEELPAGVAASLRHAPAVAFGDVIGANVAMCLVALGVGAVVAPLPSGVACVDTVSPACPWAPPSERRRASSSRSAAISLSRPTTLVVSDGEASAAFDRCPRDIIHMQNTMPPPQSSAGRKTAMSSSLR